MKTILKATVLFVAVFAFTEAKAKTTTADTTLKKKISLTATKVGHKTSELAVKGESAVVDKKYKDKVGPHGETVYINSHSKYYYVDKKGHKVYLKESELKDKKM
jgi:hypothetical protein